MRHQRLHLQHRKSGCRDRYQNDIGGRGRDARAHQDAGDGDQQQRKEQRPLRHHEIAERPQIGKEGAEIIGRLHHHVTQPKADAGQGDDTYHNSHGGGRSPDRSRCHRD